MTTDKARRMLGVKSDYALADKLGINRSTIQRWKGVVPENWRPNIKWLAPDGERK